MTERYDITDANTEAALPAAEHAAAQSVLPANAADGKRAARRRGPRVSTVIAVVMLLAGIGLISYPSVSDWWNSLHQTRVITQYSAVVEETSVQDIADMLADAQAYNDRLQTKPARFNMSEKDLAEYGSLLDLTGNGVMGYVQINSIGVDLPIYHGMDESTLQVAVGHLEGSSLPVGGLGTHTVLTGHRGLTSAKLFTDLDRLVEGDTFTVTVLGETLTYEVDQIRIVLPEDLSLLEIDPEQDYCTLVTCTPYAVNTHRLLVRGHRIDNLPAAIVVPADAQQIPRAVAIPAVAVPILFLFLLAMLAYYRRHPVIDRRRVAAELSAKARAGAPKAEARENDGSEHGPSEEGQRR